MALPIRPAPLPRAPRWPAFTDLALGDRVRPFIARDVMLVVDIDGPDVTAACRGAGGVSEITLPRSLLRKVR